jgi:hypothetical protein
MTVRRLIPILVSVFASVTIVAAQPKKPATKKTDKKGSAAPVAGSGSATAPTPDPAAAGAGSGSAVQMTEDPPPKDIEGRDENPDAPKGTGEPDVPAVVVAVKPRAGYPIEESMRPINLPANMSEVAIGPHLQVSPFAASDALRARYGITRKVQLGLTYVYGGIYDDPATVEEKQTFHGGKAVGLDVTVLLTDWAAIRVGVPVYIKPVAVSIAIGVPLKFRIGNKFALGGLDDLLNIKVKRFAPSFYQEFQNALGAARDATNTAQSAGELRFSAFGIYNRTPKTAIIGRFGALMEDFATGKTSAGGGLTYFMRAGVDYTPRKYLDLGISVGFDDLAETGSFGPAGYLAFRI